MNSARSRRVAVGAISLVMLALPITSIAADEGADLFKGKCAMCHGQDASGKTAMGEKMKIRDLRSAEVQKQTDAELEGIISKGKEKMPAYGSKLSKEQISRLVGFLREAGKKK
ncbi:MAG: cytochrome c [Acidobacteriia bacterium]|nr:cytochrome c [Terriglobia bacterium]